MKTSVVGLPMLFFAFCAAAQTSDTTLKTTTIEVIQAYKPEVKPLTRPEFTPDLPPRDTSRPAFRYEVPQQALYYTYSSLPLRPLALGKDTIKLPFANYVKLGGGTQSTLYLDAALNHAKSGSYETSLHLSHLSQSGNIENQRVSMSGLEAEGTLHAEGHAWRLALEGTRNRYHFYGYDHGLMELSRDSVQQTYTGIQAAIDVRNERQNRWGIDYHPAIGIDYYSDAKDASERTVSFDLPVRKMIDSSLTIGLGVRGVVTRFASGLRDWYNDVVQVTPQLLFSRTGFSGRAGLYITGSSYYPVLLLPDIEARYQMPNTTFLLAAGWKADVRQNTFRQLTSVNPYLFPFSENPSYRLRQTRTDEVFGMVQISPGNHLSITGKLSWRRFENLPLFLNDSFDRKNLYIVYDDQVNATSLELGLRYQVANNFSVGATAMYTAFSSSTWDRVWHEPAVRIKADLNWKPLKDLTITGYAQMLDQIYARNELGQEIKLKTIFDLGAGAEYQIIPRLSAFVNIYNLLNNRYQRWYGYESFGINIYGGLRLKF